MRKRIFFKGDIPSSVADIVVAICRDRNRRVMLLGSAKLDADHRDEYERLNSAIDKALISIEPVLRGIIFNDISSGAGYSKTPAKNIVGKRGYLARKRTVICQIALNLGIF